MLRRIVFAALILTLAVPARADDAAPDLKPVSPAGDLSPRTGEGLQPPITSAPPPAPIKGEFGWRKSFLIVSVSTFFFGYALTAGTALGASIGNADYGSVNPYIPIVGPFLYLSQLNTPTGTLKNPAYSSSTSYVKAMVLTGGIIQIAGLAATIVAIPVLALSPSKTWSLVPIATPTTAGARFSLAF